MKPSNWNAQLYDSNHSFVSKYGMSLIKLLNPQKGEKILDLGCGTGDVTNKINEAQTNVIGVDKSPTMIEKAKEKYPHIPFHRKDILRLQIEDEFDAVFSNAMLHWVKAGEEALENIYHSLKQGGRFVAEFGGKDNIQLVTNAIMNELNEEGYTIKEGQFPWYFPSIGEYTTLMEQVGFRVTYATHFDRPTRLSGEHGLRNWLTMFASSFFEQVPSSILNKVLHNIEKRLKYDLYRDGVWFVDYNRIQVIGIK